MTDIESSIAYQLRAFYDTRDSVALPTRGSFLTSRYVASDDALGGEFDYTLVEGFWMKAFSPGGSNSLSIAIGGAEKLDLDYMLDLSAAVKQAVDAGKNYADAIRDIKLPKYENLPGYQQNLPGNIERYYDFWNRGI